MSKVIRRLMAITLTALVCLSLSIAGCVAEPASPAATSPAATGATALSEPELAVRVVLSKSNVNPGETVTAEVVIDSKIEVRGVQCTLSFDPAIVACTRVDEGSFLGNWAKANGCTTVMMPQPVIDNNAGRVSDMGIAVMGAAKGGANGSGILCIYHFTTKGSGAVKLVLSGVRITDDSGAAFTPTIINE